MRDWLDGRRSQQPSLMKEADCCEFKNKTRIRWASDQEAKEAQARMRMKSWGRCWMAGWLARLAMLRKQSNSPGALSWTGQTETIRLFFV